MPDSDKRTMGGRQEVCFRAQRRLGASTTPNHKYASARYHQHDPPRSHHPAILLPVTTHIPISLSLKSHCTMMSDVPTTAASAFPSLPTAELRDFFNRLAAGDYHGLARELNISYRPAPRTHSRPVIEDIPSDVSISVETHSEDDQAVDPDASIRSIDSVESFKFKPTAEGLQRAVSLLRGDDGSKGRLVPPTPEEEEAFQFTFRLMIHKLYSIKDFAKMVDDVVRTSQERFRPLDPELIAGRRHPSLSFSFDNSYTFDGDSSRSLHSPTSQTDTSSLVLPSSPSSWTFDRDSRLYDSADDADVRAVKKRIVGRKLSVVDSSMDDETSAWVYDSAVASVESPLSYSFFDVAPFSPAADSPSRAGYSSCVDDGDFTSRKRRFSLLAARGL